MNQQNMDDLSSLSMLELFRVEAENQSAVLNSGLLELERDPGALHQLEALMRAAHSLKGAARIVNLDIAVRVAHALEDCFVAAQHGKIQLRQKEIDVLFRGVDLLLYISKRSEAELALWETDHATEINDFLDTLTRVMTANQVIEFSTAGPTPDTTASETAQRRVDSATPPTRSGVATRLPEGESLAARSGKNELSDRVLRLTAENLNRLLGLAGESLVGSRWLHPFADSMLRLKRQQSDLAKSLDGLRESLTGHHLSEGISEQLNDVFGKVSGCRESLTDRLADLEMYDRRSANLSHRLYLEVLKCRMRPFGEGVVGYPRMVRDLARSLGKEVQLEIIGENTQVDRDILEKLEAPLAHLLRNAVDHGCEPSGERQQAGKPLAGAVRLEARHSAGMLLIIIADDGAGIDPERLRQAIVEKKMTTHEVAEKLSEAELYEFLFLPGFTMKETVTEISGRGVGLDVVLNMVKSVRGTIRVNAQRGKGTRFQLQLPITLSVIRTLLVEVAGEPYAIPLAQISRTLKLPLDQIESLEGRHHFLFGDQHVGLLAAHQVLDCGELKPPGDHLPVVVLGDRATRYGLVVDNFLGERELVVQALDPRLGKVKDISAAALMEDGSPVLIVDVEDLVRSIDKLVSGGQLSRVNREAIDTTAKKRKRILAVDDSLTVRELERKLLTSRGYVAEVAVDGMDGWNAVRTGNFDLVITDVDMPRLDGIELVTLIKKDAHLSSLPVMIVSYKDREEDRLRGLEAGADYYLTKGSFHDETLLQAVVDLIGEPES